MTSLAESLELAALQSPVLRSTNLATVNSTLYSCCSFATLSVFLMSRTNVGGITCVKFLPIIKAELFFNSAHKFAPFYTSGVFWNILAFGRYPGVKQGQNMQVRRNSVKNLQVLFRDLKGVNQKFYGHNSQ